ncbi:MAG: L-threonine 3-dehydrogenase [Acidobacteriota bacterium]
MQALLKTGPEPGLRLMDVERPKAGPSDVLIHVAAASICGTDRHIYDWDEWASSRVRPPRILGHEFCGHVAALGAEVRGLAEGDFVSAEGHVTCGTCYQCRTGAAHICQRVQIVGIDRDGAFADYVMVPATNVWRVDPRIPTDWASVFDPFGNAVHTVYSVGVRNSRVALFGCGSIGLFSIAVARAVGAEAVYAVDVIDYRLELAERLGATATCNARTTDPVSWLRDLTMDRGGVDVVLEISGNPKALNQGLQALRDGGEVAILGIPSSVVPIDIARDVVFKGATLVGVVGRRIWATWYQMQSLLVDGSVDLEPVLTHRIRLGAFEEAFTLLRDGLCGKIVLIPG